MSFHVYIFVVIKAAKKWIAIVFSVNMKDNWVESEPFQLNKLHTTIIPTQTPPNSKVQSVLSFTEK